MIEVGGKYEREFEEAVFKEVILTVLFFRMIYVILLTPYT
jgi:hypothetical protein